MDFQTLHTFSELAKCLSFSQTAQSLFISQSTVTKRISELEKELEKPLFTRDKRHVALTSYGQLYLEYVERILSLEKISIEKLNAYESYSNNLKIGATNSIYECHLFDIINAYEKQSPDNAISISIDHSQELLQFLQDGILDLVFTFIPFYKAGYECKSFHSDRLVLTTSYKNTDYVRGIRKADLTDIKYLMCNFALNDVGSYIRGLFPNHYQFKFEIDNSTKLLPYLLSGYGYSFLPEKMLENYIKKKELRIIPLLDIETPEIKSYYVGRLLSKEKWSKIF
ncbi:MAG: LysR family transcriptional regulator [Eubacteriales bacterium]|nr:LysR family transcriptional regulator [Eubacteriales bacterium]